jgi:cytochrome c553
MKTSSSFLISSQRVVTHPVAALFLCIAITFSLESASFAADIEAGKQKAQICMSCHGPAGNSEIAEIPALAGQTAQAITTSLYHFREGNRKNPVMSPFAANLSNADMNNLAAYFASEKRIPAPYTPLAESLAQGPELAKKYNCVQCHGAALLGQQHIPRVSGQQHAYLLAQLKGFKATTRYDMDGNMSSAASMLKDNEIEILADYISGLH